MCGIFAALKFDGFFGAGEFEKFAGATDAVSYRGPDSSGVLSLDSRAGSASARRNPASGRFDVFLGHRRLSIIDLSDNASQPMADSGRFIVFNGEIFNYVELREELKKEGYVFRTDSDTEVVMKIYDRYGEEGFAKLNGMWAFVIVDPAARKAVASRDRFSIKPLYYRMTPSCAYFASEIKQLLRLSPQRELNGKTMGVFLAQSLLDYSDETFFKGVLRVPPKTNAVISLDTGACDFRKYWDYTVEDVPRGRAAFEKFRALFYDSVRIRLRSDVKVGSLLSGGLDSSSVTAAANSLSGGNFESFSVVTRHREFSEEPFVDILSRENGVAVRKLFFDSPDVLSTLDEVLSHQDEPFASFSMISQYEIFRKIKKEAGITVVLSGQGGDEALMGYLKYYFFRVKNLLKRGRLLSAAREVAGSLLNRTAIFQLNIADAKRYMPFLGGRGVGFVRRRDDLERIWSCDDLNELQKNDLDRYSVPVLARYEDRNAMAHSVESRLPFLDHRLVNFLLNLPVEAKLSGGWSKYILRSTMREVPAAIRWRRDKMGFVTPEKKWLREDLRPAVESVFRESLLHEMGFIDKRLFFEAYSRFLNGRGIVDNYDISRTLIAEMWLRKHFGGSRPSPAAL